MELRNDRRSSHNLLLIHYDSPDFTSQAHSNHPMLASKWCTVMTTVWEDWLLYCGTDVTNLQFQKTSSWEDHFSCQKNASSSPRRAELCSHSLITNFIPLFKELILFFPSSETKVFTLKESVSGSHWVGEMPCAHNKSLLSQWVDIWKKCRFLN